MSYEYKDEIIMNLKDYNAGRKVTGGTNAFESKLSELDQVYAQAAKSDEYEAKSEAFDRIVEERNRIGKLMHNKEYPQVFTDEAFWNIDDIIIDTESGESDA